jgi:hypothetical protein
MLEKPERCDPSSSPSRWSALWDDLRTLFWVIGCVLIGLELIWHLYYFAVLSHHAYVLFGFLVNEKFWIGVGLVVLLNPKRSLARVRAVLGRSKPPHED